MKNYFLFTSEMMRNEIERETWCRKRERIKRKCCGAQRTHDEMENQSACGGHTNMEMDKK